MIDLSSLNPEQREAVITTEGPLLVLAGAGSGKTRVITMRIAHLLERGVAPKRILALSFTNKAAGEMKERVEGLCGPRADGTSLSTFHALGLRFLREEFAAAGLAKGFTILDEGDQIDAVRTALKAWGYDPKRYNPRAVHSALSWWKSRLSRPDPPRNDLEGVVAKVMAPYARRLKAMNAVDFDDLIARPWWILSTNKDVSARWAGRFRYVMVDEYQDTNLAQLGLLKALVRGQDRPNICVVGDDDQSIYAFRGAVAANILGFDKHFPGARIIALTRNYRSTNNILRAANAVIAKNTKRHDKELWSKNGDGPLLRYLLADDGDAEAHRVATDILRTRQRHRLNWSDFTILYRKNAQSRSIEAGLRADSIPYRIIGGTRFYDRKEVRDLVGYLRVIANPYDEAAWRRIVNYPPRGIGDRTITRLGETAQSRDVPFFRLVEDPSQVSGLRGKTADALVHVAELVEDYRTRFNGDVSFGNICRQLVTTLAFRNHLTALEANHRKVEQRMENLDEIADALDAFRLRRPTGSLADFLAAQSLDTRKDESSGDGTDEVTLMTLHRSKGLEFPCVYLVGCERGLLPSQRYQEDGKLMPLSPEAMSEERRLMYVGITRAKRYLTLTGARKRMRYGTAKKRSISPFIFDIPPELIAGGHSGKPPERVGDELQTSGVSRFGAMQDILGSGRES